MSLEKLKKEGWFNNEREEISLPDLTDEQLQQIKNKEEVVVHDDNDSFLIYIKKDADSENLKKSDLIIRRLPTDGIAARQIEI